MKNLLLGIAVILAGGLAAPAQDFQCVPGTLLGTTNRGELVWIDPASGSTVLIGVAGTFSGKQLNWTGLSFDPVSGALLASSRWRGEPSGHTHIYQVDPATGLAVKEIGDTGVRFGSDLDFDPSGILYLNFFQDSQLGVLAEIDLDSGAALPVGSFGSGLQNGALSVDPVTEEIFAVTVTTPEGLNTLFQVDPGTGQGLNPIVLERFYDGLEIVRDGRFFAVTGGPADVRLYSIDPVSWQETEIPLDLPPLLQGSLNGLEECPAPLAPAPLEVTIDIKPDSDRNPLNPFSRGEIPVAILSGESFDAAQVDPASVRFGPAGAEAAHQRVRSLEDVNSDGLLDLLLHFATAQTGIQCGDTEGILSGETFDGHLVEGTDALTTVGCRTP